VTTDLRAGIEALVVQFGVEEFDGTLDLDGLRMLDATRALLAAHPVQVTTAEELDALPVGSVVLDGMGDAWQRSDAHTDWWAPANPFYVEADAANVLEQGGTEHPVTVLYRAGVTP